MLSRTQDQYHQAIKFLQSFNWLPIVLGRASIGSIFILTGWGKLHSLQKVTGFFMDLGIPFPELTAHLVSFAEFGCGLLIFLGLLTRAATIPLIVTMSVAMLTAKQAEIHGISDLLGLDEFIYIIFLLLLLTNGSGNLSFDRLVMKIRLNRPRS